MVPWGKLAQQTTDVILVLAERGTETNPSGKKIAKLADDLVWNLNNKTVPCLQETGNAKSGRKASRN